MNQISFLKNFIKNNLQTSNAVETDLHGGSILANGGIKNHVLNGFISIGDAAGQINPIAGEGIRHAMYSGKFAAEVIDSALDKASVNKNSLEIYNKLWKTYIGNKWKTSLWLQRLAYQASLNQKFIDTVIRRIKKLDSQSFFEAIFNYKFSINKFIF